MADSGDNDTRDLVLSVVVVLAVLAFIAAVLSGCASGSGVAIPIGVGSPKPVRGLSGCYHGACPSWLMARLPVTPLVLRVAVQSPDQARQVLAQLPQNLSILVLVEGPDLDLVGSLAVAFAKEDRVIAIELGNELELPPWNLTAQQFTSFESAAIYILQQRGWTKAIISGGVYALTDDTKQRLNSLSGLPVYAGVHLYDVPSAGDVGWLQTLGLPIAVTEFGMPTPTGTGAEQQAQLAYLQRQMAIFAGIPAKMALVYQCCDGPTNANLDRFGLFNYDGFPKAGLGVLQ